MKKHLYRITLVSIAAAILAACPSKSIKNLPETDTSVIKGPDRPTGTPDPIGTTVSGGGANYTVVSYNELPHWDLQHFTKSLQSFRLGCENLKTAKAGRTFVSKPCKHRCTISKPNTSLNAISPHGASITAAILPAPLPAITNRSCTATTKPQANPVSRFTAFRTILFRSAGCNLRGSKATVCIRQTGQNSGVIDNSGTYTADLSRFPITARSTALKGRFEGSRFVPYYTRSQINGGALNGKAPILGYADDPVELFFMHIQGSGRLKTPSGKYIRVGFADKNEHPYVSIGRYMADKGYLPLGQTSMQGIKAYMKQNPGRLAEVLGQNPSYVFFRELTGSGDSGPVGALGTPLMGEYAGAIDRHYITLGAPLFVATAHPTTKKALNRLIMAQDTGSAIKGAVRVDYFWGYGDEAGEVAGKMKTTGYVWQLLPNGMKPEYRP